MNIKLSHLASLLLAAIVAIPAAAVAQGTAFTYQGRLSSGTTGVTGLYDFRFAAYDAASSGSQIGSTVNATGVGVTNGLFTVTLDFGVNVFTGAARFLDLAAKTNGSAAAFVSMTPRQPLTPAPYAVYAANANAVANGAVGNAQIAGAAVQQTNLIVGGTPGAGKILSSDGNGLTWIDASTVNGSTGWGLTGNAGTTAGANFLGTTDNQPLEFRVNGLRALRIEPNTNLIDSYNAIYHSNTVNIVAGSSGNKIADGVLGSVIAGGGNGYDYYGGTNLVASSFSLVGGGYANVILTNSFAAVIGGGTYNRIQNGAGSVVVGGSQNSIFSDFGTLGGGYVNLISTNSEDSVIGGGQFNQISRSPDASIAGGQNNYIVGGYLSFIGGGQGNLATNTGAMIVGGAENVAGGVLSFAAGTEAKALHDGSFVWSDYSMFSSPFESTATNQFSVRARGGVRFVTGGAGVTVDGVPIGNSSPTFTNSLTIGTTAGQLTLTGEGGQAVAIEATGGQAPGRIRVRNGLEIQPKLDNSEGGYLDLRNKNGNATIIALGDTGGINASNLTTVGDITTTGGKLAMNSSAGNLTIQGEGGVAVAIEATGGLAPGRIRVRNGLEVSPSSNGSASGYLDVRNNNGPTISLNGANGGIAASNLTTVGNVTVGGNLSAQNTAGVSYDQTNNESILVDSASPVSIASVGCLKPATGYFIITAYVATEGSNTDLILSLNDVTSGSTTLTSVRHNSSGKEPISLNWVVPITSPGGYQNFQLAASQSFSGFGLVSTIRSHNLTVLYVPRLNQ